MELQFISAHEDSATRNAVRFILDTNVAAPLLRWMSLGAASPEAAVVDAFAWLQGRSRTAVVAAALGKPTDLAVDMRLAVIESSRRSGEIDGERLARLDAAQVLLGEWVASAEPISRRISAGPPRLRPRRQVATFFEGATPDIYHLEVMVCLVRLAKIHRDRKAGLLTKPSHRLDALDNWLDDIRPVGGLSGFVFLAAVQTALAGDGSPARTLCKFGHYRDRKSALKASANASWDMLFLRMMHASELGLAPYRTLSGPTTLLTFDLQFAESAKSIVGAFKGAGSDGLELPGSTAKLRRYLQRDVAGDRHMLERLDEIARRVREEQRVRLRSPNKATESEMTDLLDEALMDLFQGRQ